MADTIEEIVEKTEETEAPEDLQNFKKELEELLQKYPDCALVAIPHYVPQENGLFGTGTSFQVIRAKK